MNVLSICGHCKFLNKSPGGLFHANICQLYHECLCIRIALWFFLYVICFQLTNHLFWKLWKSEKVHLAFSFSEKRNIVFLWETKRKKVCCLFLILLCVLGLRSFIIHLTLSHGSTTLSMYKIRLKVVYK